MLAGSDGPCVHSSICTSQPVMLGRAMTTMLLFQRLRVTNPDPQTISRDYLHAKAREQSKLLRAFLRRMKPYSRCVETWLWLSSNT